MTPLFDRLLVRKAPLGDITTDAGILIATQDLAQAHERGEVVSVGPEVKFVEAGNFVHFAKGSGSPILVGTETLYLLREVQLDLVE
jgi:co-chaperonin GroES (HSP10)